MPRTTKADISAAVEAYKAVAAGAADMREPNAALSEIGQTAAVARAPHRTGVLGSAIESSADERASILSVSVPYARWQEFGTRYVHARRYMAAGRRAMRNAAPEVYRAAMERVAERATR